MSQWIDFKKLRRELNFETVLTGYGVTPNTRQKKEGRQHIGSCPLLSCKAKPAKKTFSANVDIGIWQCFGCRKKGNVLDFIALMEGLDISNGADMRKAALAAKRKFFSNTREKGQELFVEEEEQKSMKTVVNAPLDFELKSLDSNHPWFEEQGLSKETVNHFGLGFCRKGLLKGRIAIPLRDSKGRLIGYAGRLLDAEQSTAGEPLYIFPDTRKYNGILHKFCGEGLRYNQHACNIAGRDLVIANDVMNIWRLWQHHYTNLLGPQFENFC